MIEKLLAKIRKAKALKRGIYIYGCDRKITLLGDHIGTDEIVINDKQFIHDDNRFLSMSDFGRLFSFKRF
ncbi:MAG: hypothetical protein KBT06_04485 [Prevotellaceae bacterium]|nr:hypothetical protein [Candidatus Colivivens equi]